MSSASPAVAGAPSLTNRDDNQVSDPSPDIRLRAPRAVGWEVILFLATLGIYFCLYLVRLTRELGTVSRQSYTPWLWIFVPFFLFAQLFAYPKLLGNIRQVEEQQGLPDTWGAGQALWILAMCATTLVFNLTSRVNTPDWLWVTSFLLSVLLFALLHVRVNRIRNHFSRQAGYSGKKDGYTVPEWILVVALLPMALALVVMVTLYTRLFGGEVLQKLEQGQLVTLEGHPFALRAHGNDWSSVEVGSHSDGTALLELEGKSPDTYYVVFHHRDDASFDELSLFRVREAREDLNAAQCQETRSFHPGSLNRVSTVLCEGTFVGDRYLYLSQAIETDRGIYEISGEYTAAKLSFEQGKQDFLDTGKEFYPQ